MTSVLAWIRQCCAVLPCPQTTNKTSEIELKSNLMELNYIELSLQIELLQNQKSFWSSNICIITPSPDQNVRHGSEFSGVGLDYYQQSLTVLMTNNE